MFSRHASRHLIKPRFLSQIRYKTTAKPPPFPTIPSCPSPTCACAPTPSFPEGFEIDYSKPLNGSMPAYDTQVLFCTGERDWPSKIEDMNSGSNVVSALKNLIGRGGEYHNVCPPFPHQSILTCLTIFILALPQHSPNRKLFRIGRRGNSSIHPPELHLYSLSPKRRFHA